MATRRTTEPLLPLSQRLRRPPVAMPRGLGVYSYACPRCDMILGHGIAYTFCPVCDAPVDWVDLRAPVWCCATCDAMINQALVEVPSCGRCARPMKKIRAWERPPPPKHIVEGVPFTAKIRSLFETPLGLTLFAAVSLLPALSLALDPRWRWLGIGQLLPAVLVPLILGGYIIGSVAASAREIRDLVKDRRIRIIHGIEHATVVVLLRRGFQVRGGQTDDGYFKLWLQTDQQKGKRRPKTVATDAVRRACRKAIERLRREKWSLAIHPKCGTTWTVLFLLASFGAVILVGLGLFAKLLPSTLLTIVAVFVATLTLGARPLGYLLQRTMTIGVDFQRATVQRITRRLEPDGAICYYVHLEVEIEGEASGLNVSEVKRKFPRASSAPQL